jgi:NAD(P)-dependent dehydrogenase (short-subunit alcohol dehydrogenase family)
MDTFTPGLFAGKAAFVAGGTNGINLAIARGLAAAGARVTVIGRDPDRAAAAQAALGGPDTALGLSCDVREYDRVEAAFEQAEAAFGPIDIVVSGAAGNFFAPAFDMSARAFRVVVDIDLMGTFNVFRAAKAHLRPGEASLIAVSAPLADMPRPMQAHACAAKAGVNQLVRVLAMEWGRDGVRVNGISPGPIAGTKGLTLLGDEVAIQRFTDRLALPRLGSGEDIANAAIFLCSQAAGFITGTIIDCDGGLRLGDATMPAAVD